MYEIASGTRLYMRFTATYEMLYEMRGLMRCTAMPICGITPRVKPGMFCKSVRSVKEFLFHAGKSAYRAPMPSICVWEILHDSGPFWATLWEE
jgi:hypothetical protein